MTDSIMESNSHYTILLWAVFSHLANKHLILNINRDINHESAFIKFLRMFNIKSD